MKKFYAVTTNNLVYKISIKKNGQPLLEKIANHSGNSKYDAEEKFSDGNAVAIGRHIFLYRTRAGRGNFESIASRNWGGYTPIVVALFKTKKEAINCSCKPCLEEFDSRFAEETKKVLVEIGENHPVFHVITHHGMALVR